MKRVSVVAVVVMLALGAAVGASALTRGESKNTMHAHPSAASVATASGADLRVTLDRLLGEHMLLASKASQRGFSGGKDFPAAAKSLDRNSVELANAIGSIYGANARQKFLNGKLLWRDHIRFFVNYTVAKAKRDKAGQQRAVGNLMGYVEAFSSFLAGATGLPKSALRASIKEHVMHLKGQIDAYAAGNYSRAATLERTGYRHMIMTGDTLAVAIVKKFPQKFGT